MATASKDAPKAAENAPAEDNSKTNDGAAGVSTEVQVDSDTKASKDVDYLVPGEVSNHEGDVIVPAGAITKNERLFPDEPASPNNPLLAQLVSVPQAFADRVDSAKDKKDEKAEDSK